MCGIAGIYNLDKNDVDGKMIKRMTDIMAHRGPDDEGFYVKKNVGLGHRRLSIIDLSESGHQPMCNEDKTVWITYNGEVYNYIELRKELERSGHLFNSRTDTEVIIHAYEEWGEKCLDRFNGMFSFAIWDEKKEQLFCARDRFGVKPFYYYFNGKSFVFASEIKAINALSFFKLKPNDKIIYDYLAFGITDHTDETFFNDIKSLYPGSLLFVKKNGLFIEKYYKYDINSDLGKFSVKKNKTYAERILELLQDSIRLRLRSDVSMGSCLSGGLDSSAIVCLSNGILFNDTERKNNIVDQDTFSSCFEDERFDERKYISRIIEYTKARPNYVFPSSEELMREINDLLWYQEEPFASTSIYAQWNIMKIVKKRNIKVLLDGQGADEVFAGYHLYFGPYFNQLLLDFRLRQLVKEIKDARDNSQESLKMLLSFPFKDLGMALPATLRTEVKRGILLEYKLLSLDFYKKHKYIENLTVLEKSRTNLSKRLWQDLNGLRLSALLRYEDKNSMAFSIETRLPFLDYRLVEFMFSLPACYKIHGGWTKNLLRESLKGRVPEEIRLRKDKMGFVTSEYIWLRNNRKFIEDLFRSKDFRSGNYVNPETVIFNIDKMLYAHEVGISVLWRFINLELWMRKFF